MAAQEKFSAQAMDGQDPAYDAEAVTKSDTVSLARISRALWVGGAGDISVEMAGVGTAIIFVGVPAGTWMPLRVTRINSTGTTATNIVAVC